MPFVELQGITTEVDVIEGPPSNAGQEKKAMAAVAQACAEAAKKGKGLVWKKPSGKQPGSLLEARLSLVQDKKGNKLVLEAEVTIEVRTAPGQKSILRETGTGKAVVDKPEKLGKQLESLAYDVTFSLMQKKVVKVLEKQAAESSQKA